MNAKRSGTQHIRWQVIVVASGVALLATLLTYVAVSFTTSLIPARGGTYIEGMVGQPRAINPLLCHYNDVDRDLCSLVFNGLVRLDPQGVPQPDLAARAPEVSPDGLVYTVTLRNDVRWHDGQPFTADDVLFTINLIRAPSFPGPEDWAELWQTVEISRVNAHNLAFRLQQPYAPFADYLTLGILPAHVLRAVPPAELVATDFNLRPVGTGPFKVETVAIARGQIDHVILSANSNYFGSQPFLDRIEFKFFADDASVFNAYRAGQVQGIARVPYSELPRLRQFPRLNVFSAPVAGYSLVFLNHASPDVPFFQDRKVRLALFAALDRQQFVNQIFQGHGLSMPSPLLPGTWAFDPALTPVAPDVDRARALLDEAGWKLERPTNDPRPVGSAASALGGDVPLALPPGVRNKDGRALMFALVTNNDAVHIAMAKTMAEQWAAIGVSATVKAVPMVVTNYLAPHSFEAALIDFSLAGDPDPYPIWHETQASGGQNYGNYKDRDMSEILEQARRTNDRAVRWKFYQRFQKMFMEDMPALPLVQPMFTFAVDERVRGVQIGPLEYTSDRFRNVTDWYVVTRRVIVSNREP
jgi:peptide/nickel transport system substrate-binding protein